MARNQEFFGKMRPQETAPAPSPVLLSCSMCPEKLDLQKSFHEIFLASSINTLNEHGNLIPTSQTVGYYRLCAVCTKKVKAFLNER